MYYLYIFFVMMEPSNSFTYCACRALNGFHTISRGPPNRSSYRSLAREALSKRWFPKIFDVHPGNLGKWSNLRIMFFQMGWNHQLVKDISGGGGGGGGGGGVVVVVPALPQADRLSLQVIIQVPKSSRLPARSETWRHARPHPIGWVYLPYISAYISGKSRLVTYYHSP